MWLYPCSYICNCLKMPKKSQINEYSDTLYMQIRTHWCKIPGSSVHQVYNQLPYRVERQKNVGALEHRVQVQSRCRGDDFHPSSRHPGLRCQSVSLLLLSCHPAGKHAIIPGFRHRSQRLGFSLMLECRRKAPKCPHIYYSATSSSFFQGGDLVKDGYLKWCKSEREVLYTCAKFLIPCWDLRNNSIQVSNSRRCRLQIQEKRHINLRSKKNQVRKPFRGAPNCRKLKRNLQSFEGPSFFWSLQFLCPEWRCLKQSQQHYSHSGRVMKR